MTEWIAADERAEQERARNDRWAEIRRAAPIPVAAGTDQVESMARQQAEAAERSTVTHRVGDRLVSSAEARVIESQRAVPTPADMIARAADPSIPTSALSAAESDMRRAMPLGSSGDPGEVLAQGHLAQVEANLAADAQRARAAAKRAEIASGQAATADQILAAAEARRTPPKRRPS